MAYIGIDLGTSAVKLIIMDRNGSVMRTVSKDYPNYFPQSGWSEQDPLDWYNRTIEGLAELVVGFENEIEAISFSGQMHGLVLLDENDVVIRPAILWNDQRTTAECEYLNKEIGVATLNRLTANKALTGFTAPKVLWVREHEPEHFARIDKIMLPKDYLLYRLSGCFATDVSDASGTLYFDVEHRCWSSAMLDILGVSEVQLPKVFESFQMVGHIRAELAAEFGLPTNVKIVAGGGDQAVGAIGTGSVDDRMCSLALGTSGVVYVATDTFTPDQTNAMHVFADGSGYYHIMGVMLSAAGSLKWWQETVLGNKDYSELAAELAASKDNSVFFLPYLSGERTPINDADARGLFIGMDNATSSVDMTRAVIEGVTFALNDSLCVIRDMGIQVDTVRVTGGGAKNDFWCQLIADVMDVQVERLAQEEGPAYGAAILAAVGSGAFADVRSACHQLIQVQQVLAPRAERVSYYRKKYSQFKEIYSTVRGLYKTLLSR